MIQKLEKELPIISEAIKDNGFISAIDKELSEAPKKPDFNKYLQAHYKDIDNAPEYDKERLFAKFKTLLAQNKVPENCYTNDIKETHTYKILNQVQSIFNDFKAAKIDYLNTGEGIVNELTELSYKPVIGQIIDVIIKDSVSIPAIVTKQQDRYKVEKLKLNNFLRKYLNKSKQEAPITPETVAYNETFIKLIEDAESKFKPLNKTKIQIAAFIEVMFDKGWLANRLNRLKTCNEFARCRYKKNVNASLTATKKAVRETHKKQIMKYFN